MFTFMLSAHAWTVADTYHYHNSFPSCLFAVRPKIWSLFASFLAHIWPIHQTYMLFHSCSFNEIQFTIESVLKRNIHSEAIREVKQFRCQLKVRKIHLIPETDNTMSGLKTTQGCERELIRLRKLETHNLGLTKCLTNQSKKKKKKKLFKERDTTHRTCFWWARCLSLWGYIYHRFWIVQPATCPYSYYVLSDCMRNVVNDCHFVNVKYWTKKFTEIKINIFK